MKLPDVTVLLHAVHQESRQHAQARAWMEAAFASSEGIGFAWVALLGFVRLATRHGIMSKPLPVEQATGVLDVWLNHPAAEVLSHTDRHAGILGRLLLGAGAGGNLTTDAHLAALAIEHNAELATFDRDFARFAGLQWQLLA